MKDIQDTLDDQMAWHDPDLLGLSKRWAAYCLEHHSEAALDKGLEISKALANYHHEIKPGNNAGEGA